MEGHEDLAGSDDASYAEFEIVYGPTAATNGDAVVRFEVEAAGVEWIHLQPRVGNHVVEDVDLGSLGRGVPVFYGASGVEDEVVVRVRLFFEWLARDGVEFCSAVCCWEDSIAVERRTTPLDTSLIFD